MDDGIPSISCLNRTCQRLLVYVPRLNDDTEDSFFLSPTYLLFTRIPELTDGKEGLYPPFSTPKSSAAMATIQSQVHACCLGHYSSSRHRYSPAIAPQPHLIIHPFALGCNDNLVPTSSRCNLSKAPIRISRPIGNSARTTHPSPIPRMITTFPLRHANGLFEKMVTTGNSLGLIFPFPASNYSMLAVK
jgi:hypothetical protein